MNNNSATSNQPEDHPSPRPGSTHNSPDRLVVSIDSTSIGEEPDVTMADKDSAADDPMDNDSVTGSPATVFCIKLKQPKSNLLYKMSVPELCRTFRSLIAPFLTSVLYIRVF